MIFERFLPVYLFKAENKSTNNDRSQSSDMYKTQNKNTRESPKKRIGRATALIKTSGGLLASSLFAKSKR